MQELVLLKKAIEKVPFLKYALGIVGVAATIAIIKSLGIDNYKVPVASISILLGLMLLLVLIAKIANSKSKTERIAGYILIYLIVLLIAAFSVLFTTSIF